MTTGERIQRGFHRLGMLWLCVFLLIAAGNVVMVWWSDREHARFMAAEQATATSGSSRYLVLAGPQSIAPYIRLPEPFSPLILVGLVGYGLAAGLGWGSLAFSGAKVMAMFDGLVGGIVGGIIVAIVQHCGVARAATVPNQESVFDDAVSALAMYEVDAITVSCRHPTKSVQAAGFPRRNSERRPPCI